MRALWTEHGRVGRGIPEGAFPGIVARSTGVDIEAFARKYIAGTEEIDLDGFARYAGMTFGPVPDKPEATEAGIPGDLGVTHRLQDQTLRVVTVRDGGPGRRAGLSPGDELLALDGVKIVAKEFEDLLKRYPPGTGADLSVFRRGILTTVPVTFGRALPEKYQFTSLPDAAPRQRAIYEAWIGAPWEAPKPGPSP